MKKNVRKIWQKLKKKMAKGRVGVGHSLPIPTELKHRQYTYRQVGVGPILNQNIKIMEEDQN